METEKIAKLSKEIRIKLKEAELNNKDFLQALESVEYGFLIDKILNKELTLDEALDLIKFSRTRFDLIMDITYITLNMKRKKQKAVRQRKKRCENGN